MTPVLLVTLTSKTNRFVGQRFTFEVLAGEMARATTPLAITRATTPKGQNITSRNAGTNIISADSSQLHYHPNQVTKGATKASARKHLIAKFNNIT